MKIIVTDLTRFKNKDIVCIAGIDNESGQCIRPLPYVPITACKRLNIWPGTILEGDFVPDQGRGNPHSEDMRYNGNLRPVGNYSSEQFKQVLEGSLSDSISTGFTYPFGEGGKVIPCDHPPQKSIITLKLPPKNISIIKDGYNPQKIKLNLRDNDCKKYSYLPITDLGFFNYAMKHFSENNFLEKLNDSVRKEESVYLRVGLSNQYKAEDGRNGYWLQVNGIYTFPNYTQELRCY